MRGALLIMSKLGPPSGREGRLSELVLISEQSISSPLLFVKIKFGILKFHSEVDSKVSKYIV